MKITVEPTTEFFNADGVTVRAWKGVTEDGGEVVALVAGIRLAADTAPDTPLTRALSPIPPPDPLWSEPVRAAMARLWRVTGNLSDEETESLARMAEVRASYRDRAWPKSTCMREECGKVFRGPAAYCSHACAVAAP